MADRDDIAQLNASGDYRHSSAPRLVPTAHAARVEVVADIVARNTWHTGRESRFVAAAILAALGLTPKDIT